MMSFDTDNIQAIIDNLKVTIGNLESLLKPVLLEVGEYYVTTDTNDKFSAIFKVIKPTDSTDENTYRRCICDAYVTKDTSIYQDYTNPLRNGVVCYHSVDKDTITRTYRPANADEIELLDNKLNI